VLGVSFGGTVALAYAARHAEHPGAVIGISASAHRDRALSVEGFRRRGGDVAAEVARRRYEDPTPDHLAEFARVCLPLYTTRQAFGLTSTRNPELILHFSVGEDLTLDVRDELAAVRAPVLLIAGDEDPVVPRPIVEAVAAQIPHAHVVQVPGVGHGVFRDEPDVVADEVRAFLVTSGLLPYGICTRSHD
jgi:pimeloyl-ACP methyl ester carboxylesterase